MEPDEIELAKKNTGKEPQQIVVGHDALAIYVNQDNPLDSISVDQLAEIYGEGGTITEWKQLGVENTACPSDEIVRVSRQNSSGTYAYFRRPCWARTAITSKATRPRAVRPTWWPWCPKRPVPSATAAWAIATRR